MLSTWAAATVMVVNSVPVLAITTPENKPGVGQLGVGQNIPSNLTGLTIAKIVSVLLQVLLVAAALVFFIWLILGGIKWIMSGGDKTKIEEARDQITAALVGLIIVFAAWAIAALIKGFFGVDLFNLSGILNLASNQ